MSRPRSRNPEPADDRPTPRPRACLHGRRTRTASARSPLVTDSSRRQASADVTQDGEVWVALCTRAPAPRSRTHRTTQLTAMRTRFSGVDCLRVRLWWCFDVDGVVTAHARPLG